MRERRFIVDPEDVAEGRAVIRGAEHGHLARVLRLAPGDEVVVFDGAGKGWRARLERVERDRAVAVILSEDSPGAEPALALTLFMSMLHTDRMEEVVEKATEIGVREIVPVISRRAVVKPREGGWGRLERLRRIATSAAKQSGRLVVPGVREPIPFDEALRWTGSGGGEALRLFLHAGMAPLPALLAGRRDAAAALMVGPEGGWEDDEVGAAIASGWTGAALGGTTLRADTAAIVAAGLVMILAAVRGEP